MNRIPASVFMRGIILRPVGQVNRFLQESRRDPPDRSW
jgi:hypothetical protein